MTPRFAGIQPWFPGALGRWKWLTAPVPAERAAAFRVAVGLALVADIVLTYLPHFAVVFSPDALGGKDIFPPRFRDGGAFWSVLRWLPDSWGPAAVTGVWLGSAVALAAGWRPLAAGLVAWACAVSVWNINFGLHNGGDRLRNTMLLMAAVSSSGAAGGVSSVRAAGDRRPVLVPGWPLRVVALQLALLYFFGGVYKIVSPAWQSGYVMYFVAHDLTWSNAPAQLARLPLWGHQLMAWVTLVWELGFPAFVVMTGTRAATLWLGVFFHVATLFTLEVGCFALYSLAGYAVFVPWERYAGWGRFARKGPGAAVENKEAFETIPA